MMITWSTVWAISASTWLDMSTVRPPEAKSRRKSRSHRTPSGSSPLAGSSKTSKIGITEQRGGETEALTHAE
jgi:hypothetical protein